MFSELIIDLYAVQVKSLGRRSLYGCVVGDETVYSLYHLPMCPRSLCTQLQNLVFNIKGINFQCYEILQADKCLAMDFILKVLCQYCSSSDFPLFIPLNSVLLIFISFYAFASLFLGVLDLNCRGFFSLLFLWCSLKISCLTYTSVEYVSLGKHFMD